MAEQKLSETVAKQAEAGNPEAVAIPKFDVVKLVTLPLLKWKLDTPIYVTCRGAIFTGKKIVTGDPKKDAEKPADLMNVVDATTGRECQIIVGEVLRANLAEHYPDDAYVGKSFMLEQTKIEGKRYKGYSITEIKFS